MSQEKQTKNGGFMWNNPESWKKMLDTDHFEAALNDKDFSIKRLAKLQELEGGKDKNVDELLRCLMDFLKLTGPGTTIVIEADKASAEALFHDLDTTQTQVNAVKKPFQESASRYVQAAVDSQIGWLEQQSAESLPLVWYKATHTVQKNTY